ncbi:MAG: cation-translocating P-type ATPase [Arenicellales bacterium]|nr:cation-translocating P-type ATPase [Arenicellales bacterium]
MEIEYTEQRDWPWLSTEETLTRLEVNAEQGLSGDAVSQRLDRYGLNEIEESAKRGAVQMFLGQFADFMIFVLIVAAVVSGVVGEPQDTIAIMVIVLLNASIGAVQEYRAEKAVAALREMTAPEARVRRDGTSGEVVATNLVPGDIVQIESGGIVPADLRLLEISELKLDESALTGESHAVDKHIEVLSEKDLPLGDQRNMAFKGTMVTSGRGLGVVVATGMSTELGRVAALLQKDEGQKTPLQLRLTHFGQRLAIAVLVICALIFVFGLLRGEPVTLMFLTAVTLAVAAIPEALPAVVTVSLAVGAHKMAARNALIRRLPAVETLGSVTYICADKTGTLTQNKMTVGVLAMDDAQESVLPSEDTAEIHWRLLGQALALNNDAKRQQNDNVSGDPTEVALYTAAHSAGYDKKTLEKAMPRVAELPFDAERRCMTTVHQHGNEVITFSKGAPERILSMCVDRISNTGPAALNIDVLRHEADSLAEEGYRVLAFATRSLENVPTDIVPQILEDGLTFLGFVGLIDPPRSEAAESVRLCSFAGITPVMITGDHAGTARAIAIRIGIIKDGASVLTGSELVQRSPEQLADDVGKTQVYARVDPEQKIKIVEGLQGQGEFVAMTGDGVNDAPALKRAEIGVAMGQKGTDVAREAADMVLLDDNFATIVSAVAEGRRIFDNIRKFIKYTMTSNAGEIWTISLAPFFGLPLPLLPIHILWINLVTDGLPGLALTAEPAERGVMARPPRPPEESIFANGMWQHMIWVGLLIGGLSILSQAWAYHSGTAHWQTMVFTVLTLAQLAHVLAIRSERESLITLGFTTNWPLLGAVVLTVGLQMAVIYVPFLQGIFKTAPLSGLELLICFALAAVVFVAVEIEKWLIRRGHIYRT